MSRKPKIGSINENWLRQLEALNTYYVLEYRIEGTSDELPGGLRPYRFHKDYEKVSGVRLKDVRIGRNKFGFKTREEAEQLERIIEDSVHDPRFKAIVTITPIHRVN